MLSVKNYLGVVAKDHNVLINNMEFNSFVSKNRIDIGLISGIHMELL